MKILIKLKNKAKMLKKEITTLYYAYQDPKLSLLPKLIIIFTIGYALSPIDLIPDFIPIWGQLDDLIIIPLLITFSINLIPDKIMEDARKKALNTQIKLKKNWFFGLLFILIWGLILIKVLFVLINFLKKL
ncbi:MAG: DUF1232 domain-containing protein [Brevinematales bacterium]|nr:DUF1232 domain-containing protein [Brevinematales bacterium]